MHLYYNMASFLLKGVSLELTMGTQAFAGLLAFTLLASQMLMMLAAWILLEGFDKPSAMNACTVGFSGVLFALKYVLSRRSPEVTTVSGGDKSASDSTGVRRFAPGRFLKGGESSNVGEDRTENTFVDL